MVGDDRLSLLRTNNERHRLMDAMDLLDLETKAWQPKDGDPDKIVGELLAVGEGEGDWGPYPVLTILPAGATVAWKVFCFHSIIKNEIEKQAPRIGDRIGIKYAGLQEPKGKGKPYEMHKLVVERVAGSVAPPAAEPVGLPAPQPANGSEVPDPFGDEPF